jgi:hypothetical protein
MAAWNLHLGLGSSEFLDAGLLDRQVALLQALVVGAVLAQGLRVVVQAAQQSSGCRGQREDCAR